MTAFTPVAFLETFDLVASLPPRMGLFREAADGSHMLPLRGRGKEDRLGWYGAYVKWPEMKNLLGHIKRIGDAQLGEVELGPVFLEMLGPGTALPWGPPTPGLFLRAHLALRTNPAALMFAGLERAHLLPGQLTAVDRGVWSSSVNWGEYARIHLVCDFRKKEAVNVHPPDLIQ
jgi:hypothetical protein